ncbi:GH16 domain-containing protein [Mycena sanguinolenta]|uniref:GH16 domain-containing protein n=1 Tax=Mycena sanguinolenta TaxID=230812 RepID=A0A8H6YX57_9AGAR|nr:GH16 domain-containing protein [Mycena sanguinolenta]
MSDGYLPVDNSSSPNLLRSPVPSGFSQRPGSLRAPLPGQRPSPVPSPHTSYSGSVDSRYSRPTSLQPSISEKFHLAADPAGWGLDISHAEPDDALHDPRSDHNTHNIFTGRGVQNVGCLAFLCLCIVGLFLGYPLASHFLHSTNINQLTLHVNGTGQMPNIGNWGLIDQDTPKEAHTMASYHDPTKMLQLVFSDEFETEGRTFYPGDDPYWEAVDLHYWQTGNLEWYDPAAISTINGAMQINLTKADPATNHNLSYMGGMVTSWNKFCFTGGLIVTNLMLPGTTNVFGCNSISAHLNVALTFTLKVWPAVWTMGNLGRAGYGASLEGMWPYVYDSCDVGTLPNQTYKGGPPAALTSGPGDANTPPFGELSYLPGQRLSRCTCKDGSYVGRSAPEIDILEAQIGGDGVETPFVGQVSQSAQWAPFDPQYAWFNTSENMIIVDTTLSIKNQGFNGGTFQEATSVVTTTNQDCYQLTERCYDINGFEYLPGFGDAYISWITNNKVAWTLNVAGMAANSETQISARPITNEPLYIIANLGISPAFGAVDVEHLTFPSTMRIDWIRVYQDPDNINIGCDPPEAPTSDYINTYIEAYTNPLLTTWKDDYGQPFPKNKLVDDC